MWPTIVTVLGGSRVEHSRCEFSVIRYVPDPVKDEFVNIGVLLREEAGRAEVRFTRDWSRVRCIDPEADTAMLEALEAEVKGRLREESGPVLSMLRESFSNAVQATEMKACLARSFAEQLDGLMRLYVEAQRRKRETRRSGRGALLGQMRTAFERVGVWQLMGKRIAAARYTRPGDPLRIDCAYRPNGVVRMFQAVSLESDSEVAKGLAFSVAELTAGVRRVDAATLEMTAVVEPWRATRSGKGLDDESDRMAQYRFGVETMEREQIRVLTTSDLPRVAERAATELRVS